MTSVIIKRMNNSDPAIPPPTTALGKEDAAAREEFEDAGDELLLLITVLPLDNMFGFDDATDAEEMTALELFLAVALVSGC